ncbi:hypothetical protein [Oleisolibacter albus]|uniref:hypothetical protein n=1 Tax=Oleisolibacter albus TaxID=2171757 RepID=UPI00139023E0|nr:hypothetical protein [Oleisolibacter albus]
MTRIAPITRGGLLPLTMRLLAWPLAVLLPALSVPAAGQDSPAAAAQRQEQQWRESGDPDLVRRAETLAARRAALEERARKEDAARAALFVEYRDPLTPKRVDRVSITAKRDLDLGLQDAEERANLPPWKGLATPRRLEAGDPTYPGSAAILERHGCHITAVVSAGIEVSAPDTAPTLKGSLLTADCPQGIRVSSLYIDPTGARFTTRLPDWANVLDLGAGGGATARFEIDPQGVRKASYDWIWQNHKLSMEFLLPADAPLVNGQWPEALVILRDAAKAISSRAGTPLTR